MYSPADRDRIRTALLDRAGADERITGAALTGSAARDGEDRWSDIDLFLGLAPDAEVEPVLADWTDHLYAEYGVVEHLDMVRGTVVYRVFLLASTLQVDIAFAPAAEFGPIGSTFRVVFGTPRERARPPAPTVAGLAGMAWLYALHVRSSIERGRGWQAEYMISAMRDEVIALACLRHDLPVREGRGVDRLPATVTEPLTAGLVRSLADAELRRAFAAVTEAFLTELACSDAALADRLGSTVRALADLS